MMTHTYYEKTSIKLEVGRIHEYFLLAGPFIALTGNAPSDIWLSLLCILFIAQSAINKDWLWASQRWFKLSLVFWAWIIFSSVLSQWPGNALAQALPWIRFPIFAAALMSWLGNSDRLWRQMLISIMLGVLLLTTILVVERIVNPGTVRLWGTWAQSPKPGWYLLGFGLPVILWALGELKRKPATFYWALPLIALLLGVTLSTGEVYVTISMIFGCSLFVLFSRFWSWKVLLTGGACSLIGVGVLTTNSRLFHRFTEGLLERLPWLPTSDYYDPWIGGLNTGFLHPLLGIGVDNYEFYCANMKATGQLKTLGIEHCFPHPHNIYIQIFTETGLVGLALFTILAITLTISILQRRKSISQNIPLAISLTLIVVAFWPVSTYSQAFGQHKNMFTWFLVGWALATSHLLKITMQKEKTKAR